MAVALLLTALLLARPTYGLLAVLWLCAALLLGRVLVGRAVPSLPPLPALAGSVPVGIALAAWLSFGLALALSPVTDAAVLLGGTLTIWVAAAIVWRERGRLAPARWPLTTDEWPVVAGALIAALWLYSLTLSYDRAAADVTVSTSGWPDFGLHLPLARSFSLGQNLPPEYPLYAGPGIHYHFGFDFVAGLLERLGLRLDLAFNLPAALALAALLMLLFHLGRELSGQAAGGVTAALLVPLSSSWAFIDYVKVWRHTPSGLVADWWNQAAKLHTGPWNPDNASHWHFTLSPYLNQRQLTFGAAAGLLVVATILPRLRAGERLPAHHAAALGAFLALTYPFNAIVWLAFISTCAALFLLFWRVSAGFAFSLSSIAVAAPQALLLRGDEGPTWHPGYLIQPFTFPDFLGYWWENVGLLPVLAMAALVVVPARDRRIIVALWTPFLIGHVIQIARDLPGTNHKLFNVWTIFMAVYAAVLITRVASFRPRRRLLRWSGPLAALLLLSPTLLSGLVDIALVKNERHFRISGDREAVAWIAAETPADAVFLTQPWLYVPPSIAGRRIYLGWPGWPEGAGYDVLSRGRLLRSIYAAAGPVQACPLLTSQGIDYVQIGPAERSGADPLANGAGWEQFVLAAQFPTAAGPLRYYNVAATCKR